MNNTGNTCTDANCRLIFVSIFEHEFHILLSCPVSRGHMVENHSMTKAITVVTFLTSRTLSIYRRIYACVRVRSFQLKKILKSVPCRQKTGTDRTLACVYILFLRTSITNVNPAAAKASTA